MKAAIFNPYIDTLGGGERYTFSLVKILIDKGFDVDVEWDDESYLKKVKERFGIDITGVKFVKSVNRGDGYDVCFWVSDGSVPTMRARKNILHFQVPFTNLDGRSLINKMKFYRINHIVCNSKFTKSFIDREYGVSSIVVYPPVDIKKFKPKRKDNNILYVGRFSNLTQAKGQGVLIDAFKKFYDKGFTDWKLVMAGGVEVGAGVDLIKLEESIGKYPIEIIKSPPLSTLVELYGKAKIFWSAAGFGIDENKSPEKVEHFGITLVEAMAAGCVPVVYNSGGPKEIVDKDIGFLWDKTSDLLNITIKLVDDVKLLKVYSKNSQNECKKYDYSKFKEEFEKII